MYICAKKGVRFLSVGQTIDLSRLYGNDALKETLSRSIAGQRTSHAYLLEGGIGTGKTTLAFLTAAAMCCESSGKRPCMQCPSCRKLLRAQSPDLLLLGVESLPFAEDASAVPPNAAPLTKTRAIGVDAVRILRENIYIRPNDLDYKFYIIGHADRMTVSAQNALLKILEEPPEGAVFFLLCESRTALLPTVLSRVTWLSLEKFSDDMLYTLLVGHDREAAQLAGSDEERLRLFVRLADGAYGRALQYVRTPKKDLKNDTEYVSHEMAADLISMLFSDMQSDDSPVLSGPSEPMRPTKTSLLAYLTGRINPKAETASEVRDGFRALLDALCAALRDLALCERGAQGQLLFFPTRTQPEVLSARCSAKTLSDTYRALLKMRADLNAYPNPWTLLVSLSGILTGLRI